MNQHRKLPIHPDMDVPRSERKALCVWLGNRRKRGLPEGCYGLWKWLAPIAKARAMETIKQRAAESAAKGAAKSRKRPAWCSDRLWRRWKAYTRLVCCGMPLEVYADPLQRSEWKAKAGIRSGGKRKQRIEEVLMRKGLHPSQRKAA